MNKLMIEFSIENQPELTAKLNRIQKLVDEINESDIKVSVKPCLSIDEAQESIRKLTV
jgi:Asp-tRNA(Asn)/Glu-tRNA(Gln) amidotransferase C subunit